MKTFIINGVLNPQYQIDIQKLTISTGCRVFEYETLEDLIDALQTLINEIKEVNK